MMDPTLIQSPLPKLDINRLLQKADVVFEQHRMYDAVLYAAKCYFGQNNVTVNTDMGSIWIRDLVCLHLSLSWNEPKMYVYTYISESALVNNNTFRLFGLETMVEYLRMQGDLNRWLRNNEG